MSEIAIEDCLTKCPGIKECVGGPCVARVLEGVGIAHRVEIITKEEVAMTALQWEAAMEENIYFAANSRSQLYSSFKKLVASQHMTERPNPDDARSKLYSITLKGLQCSQNLSNRR